MDPQRQSPSQELGLGLFSLPMPPFSSCTIASGPCIRVPLLQGNIRLKVELQQVSYVSIAWLPLAGKRWQPPRGW